VELREGTYFCARAQEVVRSCWIWQDRK